MYRFKILCEISKGTFEISHKIILKPYTEKYALLRVSYDIFELWRHKLWWDGPLGVLKSSQNPCNISTQIAIIR